MPVIFRYKEYRFLFYSNKGIPGEDPHVLVRRGKYIAKFWIEPEICLAESDENFANWELEEFEKTIRKNIEFVRIVKEVNAETRDPLAYKVTFDSKNMCVELTDKRKIIVPFSYFPKLLNAPPEERTKYELSGGGAGIHWDNIDEDISVTGLILGIGDTAQIL